MQGTKVFGWVVFASLIVVGSSFTVLGLTEGTVTQANAAPSWWDSWNESGPNYTVTFTETGLPAGTNWSVGVFITPWWFEDEGSLFNTSNTTALTFSLPNGTYNFHVFRANGNGSQPHRGTFTVDGASPPPIAVHFGPPMFYLVTFVEVGLPAGTDWAASLWSPDGWNGWGWGWGWGGGGHHGDGDLPVTPACGGWGGHHDGGWGFNSSNTTSITFRLPNGTYNYSIPGVFGYTVVGPANGSVNVSGTSPPVTHVTFAALPTYTVTFLETGLPAGTNWTMGVSGVGDLGGSWHHHFAHHRWAHLRFTATSSTSTIVFNLTNGTYRYWAGMVPGYISNDSFGWVTVVGASPSTIVINFTALPEFNVTFNESGLPNGTDWGVSVVGMTNHLVGGAQHVGLTRAARSDSLSFGLPNGHYRFAVLKLSGWSPSGGFRHHGFAVTGGQLGTTITFSHKAGGHSGAVPSVLGASLLVNGLGAVRAFGSGLLRFAVGRL